MTEFKKHDRVYWFDFKALKVHGYVRGKLRDLYIVIDNEGKEWFMYYEELRMAQNYSPKELQHG